MKKILLIEDDLSYQKLIKSFLTKQSFQVFSCEQKKEAFKWLEQEKIDLVITDYWLPDGTGLDILKQIKISYPALKVIFISNYSEVRIAVKAMKVGAFEYITKPINPDELLQTIKQALNTKEESSAQSQELTFVVGKSQSFKKIFKHVELVAPTDLSVLLIGETGTGKEYLARKIHALSNRGSGPFVAVDCGAISSDLSSSEFFGHVKGAFTGAVGDKTGYLEFANGGTLFLDEIGNLQPEIQSKLLRALQERSVKKVGSNQEVPLDIRIIAATNEDLENQQQSNFRLDLYHRINEFRIDVPPLRDRKEDIALFTEHFLQQSNVQFNKSVEGLSEQVARVFFQHTWQGNLRELKNILRRAVLLAEASKITEDLLPADFLKSPKTMDESPNNLSDYSITDVGSFKEHTEILEEKLISEALELFRHNKSKAAAHLGIDRKTLYLKMKKFGIN
ncbi:sigma-54-dependent transcriptional regulator [Mongoliitalea daihaiensis]|uniref:sigma-54-dependent transcriptional regulator n=1 Tax=Mongoliitalea daihaiensis TaxID=2782006 RepID=UPI001F46F610|nr:sigma-54 dependent transcriptional regulator [Mongoliitalea daihaiensis]UJP63766.1 sigma-54-dependent Fis family transcriptional regulator [Mongoliitalea daihaiensis]